MKIKQRISKAIVYLLAIGFFTTSCSEGGYKEIQLETYDPSKPVIFSDFTPKEGFVRTRLFINGSNFGTDPSKIKIMIGDKEAGVIGSTGTQIYAMIPARAYEGIISVTISGKEGTKTIEHIFEEEFMFHETTAVGTLVGKIDPATNTSSRIDGTFAEAEFEDPWWLLFDKSPEGDRMLYVAEPTKALRRINIDKEEVSTAFTNGQGGFRNFQTMCFSQNKDTMFFADDNGRDNKELPVIHYATKTENFRKVLPYIYDKCGYSCAVNPNDGYLFYNTYFNSGVLKAHTYKDIFGDWQSKFLFNIRDNSNAHSYLIMHPDGLYAYLVGNQAVNKSMYDKDSCELLKPVAFVGNWGSAGYTDAPGTTARFSTPRQGVFVKNEEYVKDGKEDVYDFYLCDEGNHCIRLITPEGIVSTFAGRGSPTTNNQAHGWIDGDLREDARFNRPSGICYDEENAVFYIADRSNKRIRTISIE